MKRSQKGFIGKCYYMCTHYGRKQKNNSKCNKCEGRKRSIVTNEKLHIKIELEQM